MFVSPDVQRGVQETEQLRRLCGLCAGRAPRAERAILGDTFRAHECAAPRANRARRHVRVNRAARSGRGLLGRRELRTLPLTKAAVHNPRHDEQGYLEDHSESGVLHCLCDSCRKDRRLVLGREVGDMPEGADQVHDGDRHEHGSNGAQADDCERHRVRRAGSAPSQQQHQTHDEGNAQHWACRVAYGARSLKCDRDELAAV